MVRQRVGASLDQNRAGGGDPSPAAESVLAGRPTGGHREQRVSLVRRNTLTAWLTIDTQPGRRPLTGPCSPIVGLCEPT